MRLKGTYSSSAAYEVGDLVRFSNGGVYHLQKVAPAGTPPVDTRYWSLASQTISDVVNIVLDGIEIADSNDLKTANNLTTTAAGKALDARQGKTLKGLIDDLTARVAALEPEPPATET